MILRVLYLLLVLVSLPGGAVSWAMPVPIPELKARVTDLTGTLSEAVRDRLETRLAGLEQSKGSQLAVLIVPTTGEETIEQYGIRVAESWRLGRKDVDDGLLLLVAKNDRTLRIEVGYGLEGAVPDVVGKRVIEEIIVPRFKTGDFDGGVTAGIEALAKLVEGEALPEPETGLTGGAAFLEDMIPVGLLFVFVGGGILRAIFGPLLGATIAGAIAFVGAWWLAGAFLVALIAAVVVFFLTLIGLAAGGGGSGSSSSGSGGGGFSGGGGGFGGGGASGSW